MAGQNQLAPAGKARFFGIKAASISYKGRSGTTRALDLFEKLDVEPMADVAEAKDNDGEMNSMRPTNDRVQLSFTAVPTGAAASDAETIGEDLPPVKGLAVITCATDAQIASAGGATLTSSNTVIDSVSSSYTPDGHVVVTFTVTNWIGKLWTPIAA